MSNKFQIANRKDQMANGFLRRLKFALCLLPFAIPCFAGEPIGRIPMPPALQPAKETGKWDKLFSPFALLPVSPRSYLVRYSPRSGVFAVTPAPAAVPSGPSGADQVLTKAWQTAHNLGLNALAVVGGSGSATATNPFGADEVMNAVWNSTNNAIAIDCLSGCSLSVGGAAAGAVQYRTSGGTLGGDNSCVDSGTGNLTCAQFFASGPSTLNALNYGADPTGTNDSSSAIQSWLNAIAAANGTFPTNNPQGGYLPPGNYKIAACDAINLKGALSGATIHGDGQSTSRLNFTCTQAPVSVAVGGVVCSSATSCVFTVSSVPSGGYVVGNTFASAGFTGVDQSSSFNNYWYITAVSSTTITVTPTLSITTNSSGCAAGPAFPCSNVTAGSITASFMMFHNESHDAPLQYVTFRDIGFIGPGSTNNASGFLVSVATASALPSFINADFQGWNTVFEIGPSTTSGGGFAGRLQGIRMRDVNDGFHVSNSQFAPVQIINADMGTSSNTGTPYCSIVVTSSCQPAIVALDGTGGGMWKLNGYFNTASQNGTIILWENTLCCFAGSPGNRLIFDPGTHIELYGGSSATSTLFYWGASPGNFSNMDIEGYGADLVLSQGPQRVIGTLYDKNRFIWHGGRFQGGVTLTGDSNAGYGPPSFIFEVGTWDNGGSSAPNQALGCTQSSSGCYAPTVTTTTNPYVYRLWAVRSTSTAVGGGLLANVDQEGTATQCSLSGQTTPIACGNASSGAIGLSASAGSTIVVDTTAVTAKSVIVIQQVTDSSAISGAPSCAAPGLAPIESARTAGTSFSFTSSNPASVQCFTYQVLN
jgi:hypothetical protein